MAIRIDDSRLPRNADAGASSIATISGAGRIWICLPVRDPSRASSPSIVSGNPTSTTLASEVLPTNDTAAATVTRAPWSPPRQSMATVINVVKTG